MKRLLMLVAAASLTAQVWAATAPAEGLILHYTFSGSAADASHFQNHGRVFGAALAADRFGVANSAFHFNGTGAFIEALGPLPELESVTVSLWLALDSWVQVQNWGAPQVIFFEGDDGPGRELGCYYMGGLHFVVKSNEGLDFNNWAPPLGTWTHVICMADANARTLSIWISGRKVAEGPFSGGANVGYHAPFNLGRRPGVYNDWFAAGSVDEVRVYDRALSEMEIAALHSTDLGTARSLTVEIETLRLTMGVEPGQRYILQSSPDLETWTDFGEPFAADVATHTASVPAFETSRFWRVVQRP